MILIQELPSISLAKADLLGQEYRKIQFTNLNINNHPVAESELVANMTLSSSGTTSSLRHNDKQRLDCLACPDT